MWADKIDGVCACNAYGTKAYGATCYKILEGNYKNVDAWLCANDQQRLNLWGWQPDLGPLTPVNNLRDNPLYLRLGDTNVGIHLCGGSLEYARDLIMDGHIIVTFRQPPEGEELLRQCENIWYVKRPGSRRGSVHFGHDGNFPKVKRALMSMERSREVIEYYERTEGRKIHFIVPALYQESILPGNERNSFQYHCDEKYRGKPPLRSNWSQNAMKKVMRFLNRRTGLYIDIACFHGTIVEQDFYASGCDDSHEMDHAVFQGNDSGTITFDHGEFAEGEEVDLLAAYEEYEREFNPNDEEEDEGGD